MRTLFLALTLTGGLAFAQKGAAPPPGAGQMPGNPEQNCQMKCAQQMQKCMEPCMPKDPGGMEKGGGKNAVAGCAKSCAMQQQPCMQKCRKDQKGGKDKGSDGP
jgi:hypothetical protein